SLLQPRTLDLVALRCLNGFGLTAAGHGVRPKQAVTARWLAESDPWCREGGRVVLVVLPELATVTTSRRQLYGVTLAEPGRASRSPTRQGHSRSQGAAADVVVKSSSGMARWSVQVIAMGRSPE